LSEKNFVKSETTPQNLQELPTSCGVYILLNPRQKIIYIGKAVNIQNRVRSHLQRESTSPLKRDMAQEITAIQFILTQDESEALLLEEELIKSHKPHYNIRMKDDKSYPYIHFNGEGHFPAVKLARRKTAGQGYFYGPYTNAKKAREGLKTLRRIFLLRGCSIPEARFPLERPCLDHELGLCCAPCIGRCSPAEYRDQFIKAQSFLEGDYQEVTRWLENEMWKASDRLNYEKAAQLRNHLNSLLKIINRYRLVLPDASDMDFIEAATEDELTSIVVLKVRKGRLIGIENFHAQGEETADREHLLSEFFENFYLDHFTPPEKICLNLKNLDHLQTLIKEYNRDIFISLPGNDFEIDLSVFARENAEKNLQIEKIKSIRKNMLNEKILLNVKETLSLPVFPRLVEGLDISTFQGDESVGAIVAFADGMPYKKRYRKYIIRESDHPDDFHMVEEVLRRHLQKLKRDSSGFPDLLLIDGGMGQLNSALKILHEESCDLPVLSLAKENEEIFLPGRSLPVCLSADSDVLQFLQRVRNEVHRFVITFHRIRRNKKMFHSLFDEIQGIGPQRKTKLLSAFDRLEEILHHSPETIARQLEIPKKSIIELQKKLSQKNSSDLGKNDNFHGF